MTYRCPSCGQPFDAADGFCEACGFAALAPAAVSPARRRACSSARFVLRRRLGRASRGQRGRLLRDSCGRKVPTVRDRVELDVGVAAGVTDRGLRHSRNEDAMALACTVGPGGPAAVAVVCDGVSSAPRADEASLRRGPGRGASGAGSRCARVTIRRPRSAAAALAGGRALADLAGPAGAPAATYVLAVVDDAAVTVC